MDAGESAEMYLLKTAVLQPAGSYVPVQRLADELGFSQVSVNQMCRKLQDRGLLRYVPYKGVTLTGTGRRVADAVIRRRRLWEVFLVNELGLSLPDAEAEACRLEHATADAVTDRLSAFLGEPSSCPHRKPIPGSGAAVRTESDGGG